MVVVLVRKSPPNALNSGLGIIYTLPKTNSSRGYDSFKMVPPEIMGSNRYSP